MARPSPCTTTTNGEVAVQDSDEGTPVKADIDPSPSKLSRAKPYCFCCLRYGFACLVGAIIAIGIVLIILWQYGLLGGKGTNRPTVIDLGDLPYPIATAGYTSLNLTLTPVASALQYKPKIFLVETQPARGGGDARRFLADTFTDGAWTVALRAKYESRPTTAILNGMSPSSSVVVRYRIEMDDNRVSSPSVAIVVTTLTPAAPSVPGLSAFNTSSTSVSVSIVPPMSSHGSNITRYDLRYAVSSGQTPTNWSSMTVQAADVSKPHTVSALSPEQTVLFTVTAVNGVGSSPASSTYTMKTDATGASAPAKVGTVSPSHITSNSVDLAWPATNDHGAMILRYVVSIDEHRTVDVDGHRLNTTITDLARASSYTFKVHAVNSHGNGEPSDPITVKTKDTCSADPPSQPTIQAVFSDGISIRWYPATNPSCSLEVTGYRVIYADGSGVACSPSAGLNFCDITGLSNKKTYSVKVQAENSAGWSNLTTPTIIAQTLDRAPSGIGCNTRDQVRWWMSVQNNDGSSLYYDGYKFTKEMVSCAQNTLADIDKDAECLTAYTRDPGRTPFGLKPLSGVCANLMGVLADCGKQHCIAECISDAGSAGCLECNRKQCIPAFYSNGGLTRSIAPEDPRSR